MAKNKEFMGTGWRQWQTIKGCHSCLECQHCNLHTDTKGGLVYKCDKFIGKTSNIDKRFPYDNTRCKEFKDKV